MRTVVISAAIGAALGAFAGIADPTASAGDVVLAIALSAAIGGGVGLSITDIRARLRYGRR